MSVNGSLALVTGASRAIGAEFVRLLLARGAFQVYAGVRDLSSLGAVEGVVPIALDVCDRDQIATAARVDRHRHVVPPIPR